MAHHPPDFLKDYTPKRLSKSSGVPSLTLQCLPDHQLESVVQCAQGQYQINITPRQVTEVMQQLLGSDPYREKSEEPSLAPKRFHPYEQGADNLLYLAQEHLEGRIQKYAKDPGTYLRGEYLKNGLQLTYAHSGYRVRAIFHPKDPTGTLRLQWLANFLTMNPQQHQCLAGLQLLRAYFPEKTPAELSEHFTWASVQHLHDWGTLLGPLEMKNGQLYDPQARQFARLGLHEHYPGRHTEKSLLHSIQRSLRQNTYFDTVQQTLAKKGHSGGVSEQTLYQILDPEDKQGLRHLKNVTAGGSASR